MALYEHVVISRQDISPQQAEALNDQVKATIEELDRRGHLLDRWSDWNELAGHAHGGAVQAQASQALIGHHRQAQPRRRAGGPERAARRPPRSPPPPGAHSINFLRRPEAGA